jgi:hypothetical protein
MNDNQRNRAIVAEVVARAWREPEYLSKLRQNPKLILENAGIAIPQSMDVAVLENTPTLINVILPSRADADKYADRVQKSAQLLKDLPEDMEVHLHRDSAARIFITIPQQPPKAGELSDGQLETVVGGKGSPFESNKPKTILYLGGGGTGTKDFTAAVNNIAADTNVAVNMELTVSVVTVDVAIAAAMAVVVPCLII